MRGHVDIQRLREGLSGGFFWSAFVPCPEKGDDFSDENYAESGYSLIASLEPSLTDCARLPI